MLETKTKALKKMGIDNDQIKSIVDSTIKNYRHQLDLIGVEIKNQKDIDYKMLKTNTPKEKAKRQIEKY